MCKMEAVPTADAVAGLKPKLSQGELVAFTADCVREWQTQNTQFFHLVRRSTELSGPFKEIDERMVEERMTGADGLRDGQQFFSWCTRFIDPTGDKVQEDLKANVRTFKLVPSSITQLSVAINSLWLDWIDITGNDKGSTSVRGFWKAVIAGMPTDPHSQAGKLRAHIAMRLMDGAPLLQDVPAFLSEDLIQYAELLGLPAKPAGNQVTSITMNEDRRPPVKDQAFDSQTCDGCNARACNAKALAIAKFKLPAGTDPSWEQQKTCCLCFNSSMSLDELSQGMKAFVVAHRAHLASNPKIPTLKGVRLVVKRAQQNSRDKGGRRNGAATGAVTVPIATTVLAPSAFLSDEDLKDPDAFSKFWASLGGDVAAPVYRGEALEPGESVEVIAEETKGTLGEPDDVSVSAIAAGGAKTAEDVSLSDEAKALAEVVEARTTEQR